MPQLDTSSRLGVSSGMPILPGLSWLIWAMGSRCSASGTPSATCWRGLEELDTALLHGHAHGMPHMPFPKVMDLGNSIRGVDMADPVRHIREPF